jgi:hypothetical protein
MRVYRHYSGLQSCAQRYVEKRPYMIAWNLNEQSIFQEERHEESDCVFPSTKQASQLDCLPYDHHTKPCKIPSRLTDNQTIWQACRIS